MRSKNVCGGSSGKGGTPGLIGAVFSVEAKDEEKPPLRRILNGEARI
jgi:hypothetical protein